MKHRIPTLLAAISCALNYNAFSQEKGIVDDAAAEDIKKVELDAGGTSDALPADVKEKAIAEVPAAQLPDAVKHLNNEQRKELQKLLSDASTYIGGIRIQEAFEKIIEAESLAPNLFQLHNLKGAAYTKIRDFKKARISFERALELNPEAFMTKFNVTELDFVEHKFPEAEKNFGKLLADAPDMNLGTKRLIEFKILISQVKQGKEAEAKKIQAKFDFMEDTPAFYFGNAAFAFHAEDEETARGWIRSAEKIYKPQEVSVYLDSFIEVGWIDNLQ